MILKLKTELFFTTLSNFLLVSGNIRHLTLSGPTNIPHCIIIHYIQHYTSLMYTDMKTFSHTVIYILGVHNRYCHHPRCYIFATSQYIVTRYIVTRLPYSADYSDCISLKEIVLYFFYYTKRPFVSIKDFYSSTYILTQRLFRCSLP